MLLLFIRRDYSDSCQVERTKAEIYPGQVSPLTALLLPVYKSFLGLIHAQALLLSLISTEVDMHEAHSKSPFRGQAPLA